MTHILSNSQVKELIFISWSSMILYQCSLKSAKKPLLAIWLTFICQEIVPTYHGISSLFILLLSVYPYRQIKGITRSFKSISASLLVLISITLLTIFSTITALDGSDLLKSYPAKEFIQIASLPYLYTSSRTTFFCYIIHVLFYSMSCLSHQTSLYHVLIWLVVFFMREEIILPLSPLKEEEKCSDCGQLKKKLAEKDDLLEKLGVEIRSITSTTLGVLELLLDSKQSSVEQDFLDSLDTSLNRLNTLVDNTIILNRATAGRTVLDMNTPFKIVDIIDTLLGEENLLSSAKENLEITYCISPDVPDILLGDSKVLLKILRHILHNAITFTQTGGIHIIVETLFFSPIKQDNCLLEIVIQDTGSGISDQFLPHIFEPFVTHLETGGMGLGLAICHSLAELYPKGSLTIESKLNIGTKVKFQGLFKKTKRNSLSSLSSNQLAISDRMEIPDNCTVVVVSENVLFVKSLQNMLFRYKIKVIGISQQISGDTLESCLSNLAQSSNNFCVLIDSHFASQCLKKKIMEAKISESLLLAERASKYCTPILMGCSMMNRRLTLQSGFKFILKPIRETKLIALIARNVADSPSRCSKQPEPNNVSDSSVILDSSKVLVAEDNALMRGVLRTMVNQLGAQCIDVSDGSECVKVYTADPNSFSMILMDCRMPVMSGFEATLQIRDWEELKKLRPVPIIALTATNSQSIIANCLSVGMDECIIKPISKKNLSTLILKYQKTGLEPKNLEIVPVKPKGNILLAEDNQTISNITSKVLKQMGYEVYSAVTGEEAYSLVVHNYGKYDLILMSAELRLLSGISCIQKIRAFEREKYLSEKPIFLLTIDYCSPDSGYTEQLKKPIYYPLLVDLISKYVN